MRIEHRSNPRLLAHALLTALATFLLVWVGGLVTSKGAGMAVPDWPNTYGYNMFFFPISKWMGGIFYEHTHRLIASGVGLLTTILALWLHGWKARPLLRWGGGSCVIAGLVCCWLFPKWRIEDLMLSGTGLVAVGAARFWPVCDPAPRWLRRLGTLAFFAVVIQGVLGGLRVTQINNQLGIFHATLAQMFFVLISAIALFQTRFWIERKRSGSFLSPASCLLITAATAVILFQLILGATMRHQHAGLAIPDFPAAYGKLWPDLDASAIERYNQSRMEAEGFEPITAFGVVLQMTHRLVALAVLILVTLVMRRTARELGWRHGLTRGTGLWFGLVMVQFALGAFTIWTGKSADIATLHVAFGALSLLGGSVLAFIAFGEARGCGEHKEQKTARGVDQPVAYDTR